MTRIALSAVVGLGLLASGCIQYEQTLTLNADRSGQVDIRYSIEESAVSRIDGALKLADEMAKAAGETPRPAQQDMLVLFLNPTEERIRQEFRKCESLGVKIEQLKVNAREAAREVELKLSFKDLANFAQTPFFTYYGFSLGRTADGNYTFTRTTHEADASAAAVFSDPEALRQVTPLLAGFAVTLTLRTPTPIVDANTPRRGLKEATWAYNFDKEPMSFVAFQNQNLAVVFRGEGLNLPEVKQREPEEAPAPARTTKPAKP
jgi:hypothetical protein